MKKWLLITYKVSIQSYFYKSFVLKHGNNTIYISQMYKNKSQDNSQSISASNIFSGDPHYYVDQHQLLLTEAQWSEWPQDSDEQRQQLIIDRQNREIILGFMNRTYNNTDFPFLIEDADSKLILRQLKGVIGLRISLSHPNWQINQPNFNLLNHKRISNFLKMAANQKQRQLQLESLRLLNCVTRNHKWVFCQLIAEAAGISLLTKLLSERNAEILSRAILILGNICKYLHNFNNLIIQEGTIKRLVQVAENHHSNNKIKLQCCWVLSIFSIVHYGTIETPHDYELITSFLCKIMIKNVITFKPLFYYCCWALTRQSAAEQIMQHRVYENILAVDIQTDKAFAQPCLIILSTISFERHQGTYILIEKGICEFIYKCLFLCEKQRYLYVCFLIINNLARSTPHQIEGLMKHKNLISRAVQLCKTGDLAMKHFLFTRIFLNMAKTSKQKFRQFEDTLINLGVIETLVQIMTVNQRNFLIIDDVLGTLLILLEQKPSPQATNLFVLLEKLEIIELLQQMKRHSQNKCLLKQIGKMSKYFDTCQRIRM